MGISKFITIENRQNSKIRFILKGSQFGYRLESDWCLFAFKNAVKRNMLQSVLALSVPHFLGVRVKRILMQGRPQFGGHLHFPGRLS